MRRRWLIPLGVLLTASLACSLGGVDAEATAQALRAGLEATATARATSEVGPNQALETAQAQATAMAIGLAATQTALAGQTALIQSATATAIAPIVNELPKYGVDPSQGRLGWMHPPVALQVRGYKQYDYANQFAGTVARDFVASVDITWNTQFGTSGCGLALRSDGNEESLNQYLVIATRGANGHVIFTTMAQGEVVSGADMYAHGLDPKFNSANDTTNRLVVVGRGEIFSIYTNGTQIGQVVAPEYDRGFVAMVAVSESGRTQCQFDNAWLWLLN